MIRSDVLNRVRYDIGMPLVGYTAASWSSSAAATDPIHSETILLKDLQRAMNNVASDSRDKWERKMLRVIASQYEYPLPQDCLTVLEVCHNFYGSWKELDYLYHNEFFSQLDTNIQGYPPDYFTLQAQTSNLVHSQGTITTDNSDSPPILIDTSANFGVTISGEDTNPGDKIFNISDDSSGYVDYLYAGTWKKEAEADLGSSTTQLYDADAAFISAGVAVGDIVTRTPQPADTENMAWGVVTVVTSDTLTVNHLYGHDELGWSANDAYKVGTSDRIYLTSAGLVGGENNDFEEDDVYQIESYYSTLDTILLSTVPGQSDDVGTETLMVIYVPKPKLPAKHWQRLELSDAYEDSIVAKMVEYAHKRERGEQPQYEFLLDKAIGQRKIYNKGRLGHKRSHIRRIPNTVGWYDPTWVDQRGI